MYKDMCAAYWTFSGWEWSSSVGGLRRGKGCTCSIFLNPPLFPQYTPTMLNATRCHICKKLLPSAENKNNHCSSCCIIIIIMIRFVTRTYPPCWVLKAWIQKHRGKPLLFHDKCPGFFYVHYTTHGTYSFTSFGSKQLWLSVLLKDTSATTIALSSLQNLLLHFVAFSRVSVKCL